MANPTSNPTALAQRPAQAVALAGSFADPSQLGAVLERAARECHLVSPAPSCGSLPEGCEVSLSSVLVDPARETYPIAGGGGDDESGGKRGLSKSALDRIALDRIALAAGVSWDPHMSRRLDDARDPHYCSFHAVGHVRQFDGTVVTIVGTKEMDMREGSAQVESLRKRYRTKLEKWERGGRRGYEPKSPDGQINEMRLHLVGHAEAKSKNRAIRSLGIRTSYSAEELKKPFCVARLMFTGKTEDPELRRAFALRRADAMLSASRALFGEPPRMALAAPVAAPSPSRGHDIDEDDDLIDEELTIDTAAPAGAARSEASASSGAAPPVTPAAPSPTASTAAATSAAPTAPEVFTIPSGPEKGRPLGDASDDALKHFLAFVEKTIADGVALDVARATAFVAAARKELEERAVGARDAGAA